MDEAAAEETFYTQECCGRFQFTGDAAELAAVGTVLSPFAGEDSLLAGAEFRQGTGDSDLRPA